MSAPSKYSSYRGEKFHSIELPMNDPGWHFVTGWNYACLINDFQYFVDNEEELRTYMQKTFGYYKLVGIMLYFKNPEDRFMFLMRWS